MTVLNRRTLGLASFGGLLSVSGVGSAAAAAPSRPGPSKYDAVGQAMSAEVDAGRTPGVVTLAAHRGAVVQLNAVGFRDLESRSPMQADCIFRIASMTKPITGAVLLMLLEEGLWSLDDPVSKHVPAFAGLTVVGPDDGRVAPKRPMTMLDLMRCTAGLAYVVLDSPIDQLYKARDVLDPESDLDGMIGKLADMPLAFQPGERWYYSIGVDVQGYIIEKLTGQKLDQVFRERIFEPLDMVDTGFWVPPSKADRLATLYVYDERDKLVSHADRHDPTTPPGLLSGGSGLFSTARDYWLFCQMLLNGGEANGRRFLKPETVAAIHANQLPPGVSYGLFAPEPGEAFGLNVAIMADPEAAKSPMGAGSYWWGGGFGTWFSIDPANGLIVVGLNQLTDRAAMTSAELRNKATALTYQALRDA